MSIKWCDPPIAEEPPERLPRNDGSRKSSTPVIKRIGRLIQTPGQWHLIAEGADGELAPRSLYINQGRGLPGRWEAVIRGDHLYARFLGFNDEVAE